LVSGLLILLKFFENRLVDFVRTKSNRKKTPLESDKRLKEFEEENALLRSKLQVGPRAIAKATMLR